MKNFNVAYCGLYCAECRSFKKGSCPGCYDNEIASWCEIKKCCISNGYSTCADCTIMPLNECKKYNNLIAKIIGFVFRSDRAKCVEKIKEIGVEKFASEMSYAGKMTYKR